MDPTKPITVIEFNSHFAHKKQNGHIQKEYELLADYSQELNLAKSRDEGNLTANKPKNRFVDIIPCENSL